MESAIFLKTLNVMYVEDDLYIREKVASIFDQIFNIVVIASNGEEGYSNFMKCREDDIKIDVIVSDINMPKLSGLEMIKKIREVDKDVPFILTTAYSSPNFLLEAIEYGVSHYAIKPVDLRVLIKQIEEVCISNYKLKLIENKNNELLEYMHIIDQVAIVSKIDLDGRYTFVNDIFCHASGYTKQELIGKDRNMTTHKDMPSEVCDELWNSLKAGNKWSGKLKNSGKNNNEYFTKSTMMPFYDMHSGEIIEYIEISFVITIDEKEKREFRKKVIHNVQETKRQNYVARKMIDELQGKLERFKHVDILEETIMLEREKTRKFKRQSKYYEMQLEVVNLDKNLLKAETNKNVKRIADELAKAKYKKNVYFSKASDLKEELIKRVDLCEKLATKLKQQTGIIRDLRDVISYRESQLGDKKDKIAS